MSGRFWSSSSVQRSEVLERGELDTLLDVNERKTAITVRRAVSAL